MLAAGYGRTEIAETCGVTKKTLERWQKLPGFNKMLRDAMARLYDAGIAELCLGSRIAAKRLCEIIEDPTMPIRSQLQAIQILLANAAMAKKSQVEDRLQEIEDIIDAAKSREPDQTPPD